MLKKGWIVRVIRKHTQKENETCIPWVNSMDQTIGLKGDVIDKTATGAYVVYFKELHVIYSYSENVLEILED